MCKAFLSTALVASLVLASAPAWSSPREATALSQDAGHKHGEGEMHKLGRQKIGTYTVSVIMMGEAEAGKTAEFDIKLIDSKADPKVMRVWIGKEDGSGSEKATATKKETTYDADVKVPSPLPAGAKVWVEIETEAGTSMGSYSLEQGHDDHKH